MENSESNNAVLEAEVTPVEENQESAPQESVFTEDLLNEMKLYAASRMFNGVTLQQVLASIDLQCRQQAAHKVDNASQSELVELHQDMQKELEAQFVKQQQESAAAEEKKTCDDPDCDQDPETCDKPDCGSK